MAERCVEPINAAKSPDLAPSDEVLDAFRSQGDRLIDPLVAELAHGDLSELLGLLFRSDQITTSDPRLQQLLLALTPVPLEEPELVRAGQQLFQLYAPEVLLVLGCYGLPAAYAAANGAQVIYRSRRLKDDGQRRLCETAQMLLNVMQPGGLEPNGIGERSARKVRLMHALVRGHVRALERPAPWAPAFGEPINQEDLAGTLLTFSALTLHGLRKIGVQLLPQEEAGYLAVWRHVGLLLGIDRRLLPRNSAHAQSLANSIGRRQFRASPEGSVLMQELISVTNALFPIPGYGLSLMHFFLDDSIFGLNLATILDLPPANWTRALVRARAFEKRVMLSWLARLPGARARRRAFAGHFAQHLVLLQRPDKRSPFEVPPGLFERLRRTEPAA